MSRSRQIAPSGTSQVESVPQQHNNTPTVRVPGTLRLRAENEPTAESNTEGRGLHRHIRWSEDVVDNEGMGKKSSKVCCIYHKARPVGESSSESESDSNSSDPDSDNEIDNPRNSLGHSSAHHNTENHSHAQESGHDRERGRLTRCPNHGNTKLKRRRPSPNAYEKMPKTTKGR
ncbi:type 1 phosphatases regulator ypi1 [Aspergillus caelatus]|uniref:Type 1 phosphatases regulator n=2 Tax=Aspergillus subgen. Circumdati TaxID=2720871 RepID=A0A5N7ADE8_9EURO|nr:type 1 phosphatases regulator ypi1 [Aspergillus caelatus]KAE8366660.1 type 1 phosphatases regulator ypi1 [Aspergillus caelatus]KAE8412218.1 type 1 phosphatases regulator ypi1 [Aspergillus pseudocaelatus]